MRVSFLWFYFQNHQASLKEFDSLVQFNTQLPSTSPFEEKYKVVFEHIRLDDEETYRTNQIPNSILK